MTERRDTEKEGDQARAERRAGELYDKMLASTGVWDRAKFVENVTELILSETYLLIFDCEKHLCDALGREWRPAGQSHWSLVEEARRRLTEPKLEAEYGARR